MIFQLTLIMSLLNLITKHLPLSAVTAFVRMDHFLPFLILEIIFTHLDHRLPEAQNQYFFSLETSSTFPIAPSIISGVQKHSNYRFISDAFLV